MPPVGIEPTTFPLRRERSATTLRRQHILEHSTWQQLPICSSIIVVLQLITGSWKLHLSDLFVCGVLSRSPLEYFRGPKNRFLISTCHLHDSKRERCRTLQQLVAARYLGESRVTVKQFCQVITVHFSTSAKKALPRNADFICGNQKRTANPHKCTWSCGIGRDFHI